MPSCVGTLEWAETCPLSKVPLSVGDLDLHLTFGLTRVCMLTRVSNTHTDKQTHRPRYVQHLLQ